MASIVEASHANNQGGQDDYSQAFTAGSLNRAPPIRSPLEKLATSQIVTGVVAGLFILGALYFIRRHARRA